MSGGEDDVVLEVKGSNPALVEEEGPEVQSASGRPRKGERRMGRGYEGYMRHQLLEEKKKLTDVLNQVLPGDGVPCLMIARWTRRSIGCGRFDTS